MYFLLLRADYYFLNKREKYDFVCSVVKTLRASYFNFIELTNSMNRLYLEFINLLLNICMMAVHVNI